MRAGLELRLSQQLRLSPQLRQALKLLQLSQVELEVELREQLESNPVLEVAEPDGESGSDDSHEAGADSSDTLAGDDHDGDFEAATAEPVSPQTATSDDLPELQFASESAADPEWSGSGSGRRDSDDDPIDRAAAPGDDLQAHLYWQLQLSPISDHDRAIATALIEVLDINGYLRVDNAEIAATLAPDYLVEDDEIEAVRHRLQRFDPAGVGSRHLGECLLVQLD
ncbi:MAG: RNA polymerase factor sigma-54, partial [Lysobacterales bacterium]